MQMNRRAENSDIDNSLLSRAATRDTPSGERVAPALPQKRSRLPFILPLAMLCAILFLDAVLPLGGFWFHTALLTQLGSWPLLPTHLLFPGWAVSSIITSTHPAPPPIPLSWEQTPFLLAAFLLIFLLYLLALRRLPRVTRTTTRRVGEPGRDTSLSPGQDSPTTLPQ